MQLITITIIIISFVHSAAIPSSANDVIVSGQNVEQNFSVEIPSDEEQFPDWLAKMSDDEVEEFIEFFTMILYYGKKLDEEFSEDESFQA